jgi:chitin synthase
VTDATFNQTTAAMASKRKPVPRIKTPSNDIVPQEPADPRLPRYRLSDVPSTYEHISDAVDQLLAQHSEQEPPSNPTDPFQNVTSSIENQSSTDHHESQPTIEYKPYQPGQYLAPIITGETLQLELDAALAGPSTSQPDLFNEPTTPTASLHQSYSPNSAAPAEYYYNQDQVYAPPSDQSYVSSYEQSILPAGSEIDHFHHDTEAYASGNFSRASYRPPRSRSPTPAVDDEDYFIVGNESVHYASYPDTRYNYDPEKEAFQRQQSIAERPYYAEKGYLPNGHAVVYDPEPETPTSTLNSLPSETPLETRHFGPAPSGRVLRRHKTKRRVQLTNGNLVVDLNVPPKLLLPRRGEPETMKTRYTAVTCDPDQFEKKGFFLRQNETGRRTELFIVITMYNASLPFFLRSQSLLMSWPDIRKMKYCFVELCMASCETLHIYVQGKTHKHGVLMPGKRWVTLIYLHTTQSSFFLRSSSVSLPMDEKRFIRVSLTVLPYSESTSQATT